MSKQVDERVVEMRFDNKQFESNVQTTMSTLDKLKAKLHFKDVGKSFEGISKSAKSVDLSSISNSADTVGLRFSAMYTMADQALRNITNAAVNAGTKMVKALTIEPVMSGFQEYETQMNSVQTILANTQSKGSTLEDVNAALKELNDYADQTIYNFTEMTRNIGTFTAAGVDLKTSVNAIQGIANLAAVSGSTSQQASTAMYQLSQALSAGTVRLMDWNSVVNAGMGGEVFQSALRKTSTLLGTGAEAAIKAEGSFRESLKTGWLTSEVLTETLKKFTSSGANEYVAEYTGLTVDAVKTTLEAAEAQYGEAEAVDKAADALAEKSGKNRKEIRDALQMAKNAQDAATKVKTFSQLWDVMKEAAQSGWSQTWQLIVGDFEQAKNLLTPLADFFTGIINKMSKARNDLLNSALGKSFTGLAEKMEVVVEPAEKIVEAIDDIGDVVDKVILGKFGNGKERFDKLAEAGVNFYEVQNKVNEKLGNSKRYTEEQIEAQNGLLKSQGKVNKSTGETTKKTVELTDEKKELIKKIANMSEEQMRSNNYTDDQIKAFKELGDTAKKLGIPLNEFIDNMDKINGRWLLINSFKNIGESLVTVFKSIGKAWSEVFPTTDSERSDSIFNLIAGFHRLTEAIVPTEITAQNLVRTFKGVFAALDIVMTVVGGPIRIAFKILCDILSAFDLNILDVTAGIGDVIVKFRDWIDSVLDFTKVFEPIADFIKNTIDVLRDWFEEFKKSEEVQNLIDKLKDFAEAIKMDDSAADNFKKITDGLAELSKRMAMVLNASLLSSLKILGAVLNLFGTDLVGVAAKIVEYLTIAKRWINDNILIANTIDEVAKIIKALIDGVKSCVDAFLELEVVQKTIQSFKDGLTGLLEGISKGFSGLGIKGFCDSINKAFGTLRKWIEGLKDSENIGKDIMQGLVNGLTSGIQKAVNVIKNIATMLITTFKDLFGIESPSKVFMAFGGFIISGLIAGLLGSQTALGDTFKGIFNSVISFFKDFDMSKISAAFWTVSSFLPNIPILNIIAAIANMASVAGSTFVTSFKDGVQNGVSGIVNFVKGIVNNIVKVINKIDFGTVFSVLISVGTIVAVKKTYDLFNRFADTLDKFADVAKDFAAPFRGLGKALSGVGTWLDSIAAKNKAKVWEIRSKALLNMAISIGVLAGSLYILSKIPWQQLLIGGVAIAALGGIVLGLAKAASMIDATGGDFGKFAVMLLGISTSLLIMSFALKKLEFLNKDNTFYVLTGLASMVVGLSLIMVAFGTFVKGKAAQNIDKAGITILKISLVMLGLTTVIKMISKLDPNALEKGATAILGFTGIVALLIASTRLAGKHIDKAGNMILKVSAAMMLMTVVVKTLSKMQPAELTKGITCIALFGGIVVGLMAATKLVGGKDLARLGSTIFGISGSILLLAITARLVSGMDAGAIAKGIVCVTLFGGIVAGLVAATRLAGGNDLKRVSTTILAMSLSIGVLAAVSVLLSLVDLAGLAKGIVAVGLLGSITALMIYATKDAKECQKNIMWMAIAIGVMAASVVALSLIDTSKLAAATLALAAVMSTFALMIRASKGIEKCVGVLVVMTLVIGMMTGVLWLLTEQTDCDKAVKAAIGLSSVMLAMSATLSILSKIKMDMGLIKTIGGLTLMCGLLVGFGWAISTIPDVSNKSASIMTIVATMGALTLLMLALTGIGAIFTMSGGIGALSGLAGIAGLTIMVIAMCIFAKDLNKLPDLTGSIPTITIMTKVMIILTGLLTQLAIIGPFALIGIGALAGLISVIIGVGALAVAVGKLMDKCPDLEGFVDKGLPILIKMANGIGSMIGAFVGGFASGVLDSLPDIGTTLSSFMQNATDFINGAKTVDDSVLKGVGILAASVILLTAADYVNSISSFMTLGSSFADLGTQLSNFINNASGFIDGAKNIDPATVDGVKSLAEVILILTAANVLDGLTSWITGETSIADFAKQLVPLGSSLSSFSEQVNDINVEAIKAASEATKSLAEMVTSIPNMGGLVSFFTGDNDLVTFGMQLLAFGHCLKNYSVSVTDIAIEPITNSVTAANSLSTMAASIPNMGGVVAWFTGDNNLILFGTQLVAFGHCLKNYSKTVTGLAVEPIDNSIAAAKSLVQLANILPSDGGFWSWIKDDSVSLSDFGAEIIPFGQSMKQYSNKVSGINVSAMSSAVSGAKQIASLISHVSGLDVSGVGPFVSAIGTLGKASVTKFINAFRTPIPTLHTIGSNLINAVANGIRSRQATLVSMTNALLLSVINSMNSRKAIFKVIGIELISNFINGVASQMKRAKTTIKSGVSTAVSGVREYYDDFYRAGSYLVSGFKKGIEDNDYAAINAAADMAADAYRAAKKAVDSSSPSKKFMELGMFIDQGLAIGLLGYSHLTNNAMTTVGTNLINSFERRLKINSPSLEMQKDGSYIVQGIAEGIKKDMTAEEAAKKKADNIASAFQKEFDKLDTRKSTRDLAYNLWEEMYGRTASEEEKTSALIKQLEEDKKHQQKIVELNYQKYLISKKNLKDEVEIQKAYNEFYSAQIELARINNEISDMHKAAIETKMETERAVYKNLGEQLDLEYEIWEKTAGRTAKEGAKTTANLTHLVKTYQNEKNNLDLAIREYNNALANGTDPTGIQEAYNNVLRQKSTMLDIYNEVDDTLKTTKKTNETLYRDYLNWFIKLKKEGPGWSDEYVAELARDASGYDPNSIGNKSVEEVLGGMESLAPEFKSVGSSYATALGEGIQKSSSHVTAPVSDMITTGAKAITEQLPDWTNVGLDLVDSFVTVIKDNTVRVAAEAATMVKAAYNAAKFAIATIQSSEYVPSIRPVLNLSEIQNGFNTLNGLNTNHTAMLSVEALSLSDNILTDLTNMTDGIRKSNEIGHSNIVSAIANLRNDIHDLAEAIDNMDITMDGNTVVGQLSSRIDSSLGRIVMQKGRNN